MKLHLRYFTASEPDVIPADVRNHYRQDGCERVNVEIDVDEGEIEREDVWFTRRIETEDQYHNFDHAASEDS